MFTSFLLIHCSFFVQACALDIFVSHVIQNGTLDSKAFTNIMVRNPISRNLSGTVQLNFFKLFLMHANIFPSPLYLSKSANDYLKVHLVAECQFFTIS